MAIRFPARTKGTTTATGSLTTFTVAEPVVAGWRTFTKATSDGDLANGDTVGLIIVDTTVTTGVNLLQVVSAAWNNTTKQFAIVQSYQPSAPPTWGAGTRDVVVIDNPALFLLLAGGTMTGVLNILIAGSIIAPATETGLVVQRNGSSAQDAGLSLISGTAGKSKINLGDSADEDAGGVIYDNNTNAMIFRTNGSDRQTIDSSGVLKTVVGGNSYDAFAGGATTVLLFYQAAAPTGWTKVTSHNDKALRVVSGVGGGSGGSRALSSANVADHVLTISEMPTHHHSAGPAPFIVNAISASRIPNGSGTDANTVNDTADTGGSDPHTHGLDLAYIDVILCSKN